MTADPDAVTIMRLREVNLSVRKMKTSMILRILHLNAIYARRTTG